MYIYCVNNASMKYLQGQDREQLHIFPVTMEAAIGADNEVRMIEAQHK